MKPIRVGEVTKRLMDRGYNELKQESRDYKKQRDELLPVARATAEMQYSGWSTGKQKLALSALSPETRKLVEGQ